MFELELNLEPESPDPELNIDDSLANPFLESIPDEDKPIVEKYIKTWDANVTKKFQEIRDTYRPYKDLGVEPEVLQSAMQMWNAANADPKAFYLTLSEAVKELGILDDLNGQAPPPVNNGNNGGLPEYEGLPPAFVEEWSGVKQTLAGINEFIQSEKTSRESQQQQQQLDSLLKELHTKHGDFDEPAVLGRMLKGLSPEDAVKNYKQDLENTINSRTKRNPPQLPGEGSTPFDQVDRSKLNNPSDRRQLVADMLRANISS